MKRVFLTVVAVMMGMMAWAQNDPVTREQADKLDSVTLKLMNQERYADAIKTKERELAILKSLYGEKDTTYIKGLAFSAKLYYRDKQPKQAADIVERHYNYMPIISAPATSCMPFIWIICHYTNCRATSLRRQRRTAERR